ncbi:MAG: diacylglycerol kinase family protein [Patescibacteria group bacterium]
MYFYLFDQYTDKPKFAKETDLIKLKLADLGIITDKAKATPIRQVEILAREILATKKYKNIIAVGNDKTAHLVVNEILKSKENVNFGFIPEGDSQIASLCGLPHGAASCEAISARRIKKIDVGKLDHSFFLTALEIYLQINKQQDLWNLILNKFTSKEKTEVEIEFKDQNENQSEFKITAPIEKIIIANLLPKKFRKEVEKYYKNLKTNISPYDGLLNIFIFAREKNKKPSLSIFRAKTIYLKSRQPLLCFVDGQKNKRLSGYVGIKPKTLNIIVGKNREF